MRERLSTIAIALVLWLSASADVAQSSTSKPKGYVRLVGTIAGQPVVMHLLTTGTRMCGRYYYQKVGQAIQLLNAEEKEISFEHPAKLSERVAGGWNELTVTFHADGAVTGSWGTRKLPIQLHEEYPAGAMPLRGVMVADSVPGSDFSPTVKTSIVVPADDAERSSASYVSQELGEHVALMFTEELDDSDEHRIRDLTSGKDLERFADSLNESQFRDWTTGEDSLNVIADGRDRGIAWSHDGSIFPVYNDHGILVVETISSEFTGGAHETFFDSFHMIDLQRHKELTWQDFTTSSDSEVAILIEKHFRKDYGISKSEPLSKILFSDNIDPTSNTYVTDKGIGFVYPPYDIASWAVGEIEVFVPFTELKMIARSR